VRRIVRELETQEQIDAFLADWSPPEDDPVLPALLTATTDESELMDAVIALGVSGSILLALATTGRYTVLQLEVPEGWPVLSLRDRYSRAREGIAAADRGTIGPDALAQYRGQLDEYYKGKTRGHGEALAGSDIDLAEYHRRMARDISEAHTVHRKLGQGILGPSADQELQDTIDEQLGYLSRMVGQIEDGGLTPAQIADRSGRYGANGGLSFNMGMAAATAAIASTEQRFLGSCSPHCRDCLDYAAQGMVAVGSLPLPRQKCRCSENCCCQLIRYDLLGSAVGWVG